MDLYTNSKNNINKTEEKNKEILEDILKCL